MESAVTISYTALIAVVGAVGGAIGVLFRALLASKDQQITDGKAREAGLTAANERLIAANLQLVSSGDKALALAGRAEHESTSTRERA